ncbi:dihydroorotase family protein, partial [archaeon]|nr:dihydroorotase family protein [archaeon]MBT7440832.1 dihydroorotase family protein [archaeon]
MSLLLKRGKVFLDNKFVETSILIENNMISKIDNELNNAENIIDCSNKHILPGLIDIHVHFRDFGQEEKEDWISGSKAALSGGITTVLDMPNNNEPITTIEKLKLKEKLVSEKSLINFGLYIAITEHNIEEINKTDLKYVKLYYGETTGEINPGKVEKIFKNLNKDILIVAHAEENDIIKLNKKNYSIDEINFHSLIRDNKAEYTAVNFLIELAEKYGNRLHITHVSTKESMLLIKQAKNKGLKITCDSCPHYLFLDNSMYNKIGNKAKVNPSLKSKEDRKALWEFLINGDIDCICSDHAPHTFEEKSQEYNKCPSGFSSVELSVPLMLSSVN